MSMPTSTGEEPVGFTGDLLLGRPVFSTSFFFLQSSDHTFMYVESTLPLCQFETSVRDLGGKYQCLSQLMVSKVILQILPL